MPYTIKIYFTGMCLFHFQGGTQANPKLGLVLLANATKPLSKHNSLPPSVRPNVHSPRLTIWARNRVRLGGQNMDPKLSFAAADGRDYLIYDLSSQEVVVTPPAGNEANIEVYRGRNPATHQTPADTDAERDWFDWMPDLRAIERNLGSLKATCLPPNAPSDQGPVVARISFDRGRLTTQDVTSYGGQYLKFQYIKASGGTVGGTPIPHCLSALTVLTLTGLDDTKPLLLDCTGGKVGIGEEIPGAGETIRVAITNLEPNYHPPRLALYDFLWYYELYDFSVTPPPPPQDMIIPDMTSNPNYPFTPSTGTCPPGEG